jgi:ATP-dependent helicase/nuclease subunit B
MDPFLDQLASLCKEHVTRAKWVFVPSHAAGRTIGERIALEGTNWLNLRFVTPLDIALRMGAPFLVDRGTDPSEEGLGPALMMRLMLDLPASDQPGYFRPLADQPTLAQALWTTVRELRMAGIKSADLEAEAFESKAKHAELRALLESYERYLLENNRGDMATVYEEAIQHPDWCPIQPEDLWTELPDTVWPALQQRLIDAMPGERILPNALEIAGATLPRRVSASKVASVAVGPDNHPLAYLLAPNQTETREPKAESRVSLFHAGGREAEIEEVFRRILWSGAALDEVEIACASDEHLALVWEKALRHEWPVTLGPGIPASATRPGRALLGFCDWIESDFSAGHLRRLLQSGDMGIEKDNERFNAGQAARTLARAEAGWGRATYDLSLGLLQGSQESRAKDPDLSDDERRIAGEKAALTKKVRAWIVGLLASVPEPANHKVPLQAVVDSAQAFVRRSTSRVSQLDYTSGDSLAEYIEELRALGTFECSLEEALRFIRERVGSLNVAPDRPRPGHLFATRLQQASHSGRPHLFVVGLEEGRVFPVASEDPVLLDLEREAISKDLKLSTDRIDESVYAVLSRLGSWGASPVNFRSPTPNSQTAAIPSTLDVGNRTLGVDARSIAAPSVTFSYSCRDTREFRETYASWLMLQAFRLQQGDPTLSYPDMRAALGEPVSTLPRDRERSTTRAGWWMRSVVGTGRTGVTAVEKTFVPLAKGRLALERRASDEFTEFDGHVPGAGPSLDPCAPSNAFSVTDLEKAAACPFQFFLKRGLGVRPLDEDERDRDVWLDPLTRGSELHAIYAALLRRCRDANRRPDLKEDGEWIRALAQEALDRLNREMPPATKEILDRESKDFHADVTLFLEGEVERSDGEPVALELSFGRPLGEDEEELAREEPVDVDLGGGLTLRIAGRIDRVDKTGPDTFRILDYKTGGYWPSDWKGVFNGGRRLQHALYGLAAAELLRRKYRKARITESVYYFSSHKGRREVVRIAAPSTAQIAAVLADLRELILAGGFVHSPHTDSCKFCDYTVACGRGVHERAEAKASDAKLVAFGRLGAHA